jgi:hypothetical protein
MHPIKIVLLGLLLAFLSLLAGGARGAQHQAQDPRTAFTSYAAIRFFDPATPTDYGRAVTVWVMFPDDDPRQLEDIRTYLHAADRVVVDYIRGRDPIGTGIY